METISKVAAIKRYFELDGGRQLKMDELKQLTAEDREELAKLAAKELGVELAPSPVQG